MTEFLHAILLIGVMVMALFAFLGAIDFMTDSLKIFMEALRRFRERNDRD